MSNYLDDLMPMPEPEPVLPEGLTLEDARVAHQSLDEVWPARSEACGGLPLVPKEKRQEIAVFHSDCYICRDAEYRAYGLPLCYRCPRCKGHIAADDSICDDCGYEMAMGPDEEPGQGVKCPECDSWTWGGMPNCRNCRAEITTGKGKDESL